MDFESAADNLKGITETGMSQISKLATMASAMASVELATVAVVEQAAEAFAMAVAELIVVAFIAEPIVEE